MEKQTNKAIEKVKESNSNYYLAAYGFAKEWTQLQMKSFTSEDLKTAFYQLNEKPKEPRVWGSVLRELSKEGLIFPNGFSKYKDPIGHSKPCQNWISRRYSEKQSSNRKMNSQTQGSLF